jgi:ABC-2 type transport system ATP-binding protein
MQADEIPAIDVSHVSKSYADGLISPSRTQALSDVSFHVQKGEIFGLIGPNGAGKSTLIRSILHLLSIDAGVIALNGCDHTRGAWKPYVGYLPEDFRVDENMTPLNVLRLMARMRAMDVRTARKRIADVCDMLDLTACMRKKIRTISKGMVLRVGIAQAILHRPSILLLDEPTNGLDPLLKNRIFALLQEFRKDGCAILFSSHLLSEVERTANRVAMMRQGQLTMLDFSEACSRKGRLEESFFNHIEGA